MEIKISLEGSLEFIRGFYNVNQAHKSWKKTDIYKMNKRPEDPGPLQNDSTNFPCNILENNKKCQDNRFSGWTDRLSKTT
jgi:hypothetical protein